MSGLAEYVYAHTERGECKCGSCCDCGDSPDPEGHTIDMVFFKVAPKNAPETREFKRLTDAHRGEFSECNPFDGEEHGYMELGAWIGDQGLAMLYMALGTALGIFKLLTPKNVLGLDEPDAIALAQSGLLTIKAA